MKSRKTILLPILSIALVLALAVGATLSYYSTRAGSQDNEFAFGQGSVEVEENFQGWDLKEVSLKNSSEDISGVVRAMLVPRVVDAEGNYREATLGSFSEPIDNKVIMGDFTFELAEDWADNWFFLDGFFYAKKVLGPGESTPLLLKKVTLTEESEEIKAKYEDVQIKVDVIANLLQAEGGAAEIEWGVIVDGDSVSAP